MVDDKRKSMIVPGILCQTAFSQPSAALQLEFSSHPLVAVITKIKLSCKGEIEHGKK